MDNQNQPFIASPVTVPPVTPPPPQTPPAPVPPGISSSFPSIGQLFRDSWSTFTQSILQLFFLTIMGAVIGLALAALLIVTFVFSFAGFSSLLKGAGIFSNVFASPQTLIIIAVFLVVLGLISVIISSALQISFILIVNNPGQTSLLIGNFKKILGLIIPLSLIGVLSFFLTLGAFFVFVLPALIFYFLLSFVQFEVILNNQRGISAIKRSVLLVSKNFGAIFIRLTLISLIYLGVVIVIGILENVTAKNTQWVVSIFSGIINLLLGWFSLAYTITLYKQARAGLEQEKGKGIAWMWAVAIIGWLIAAGVFFAGWKVVSSGIFKPPTPPALIIPNPGFTTL